MNCPGCEHEMDVQRFPANYGGEVEIDVCAHCNGIWFDGRESLQMSPGATLNLFRVLYARTDQAKAPLQQNKPCPRCEVALKETNDMQRGTRFSYFRCQEHGRFITFFQFLREKNLVRQPNPKELQQLREQVKTVKCSNCGAPIELATHTSCGHCSAPVSILSEENIKQTLTDLQKREEKRTTVAPDAAARIVQAQLQAQSAYRTIDAESLPSRYSSGFRTNGGDLIAFGAEVLVNVLFALW
ncbi:MAG: zf-TFIIB domain-containing protein [Myxococcaceae bacterium]